MPDLSAVVAVALAFAAGWLARDQSSSRATQRAYRRGRLDAVRDLRRAAEELRK